MGQKARARRAELLAQGIVVTDHGTPVRGRAKGIHNKKRLQLLNEKFNKKGLPAKGTLTQAEAQRRLLREA